MSYLPAKQRMGDTTIEIEKIRTDGGTQPREGIDESIAREYGAQMEANGIGSFDPVIIFYDGQDYWLADGFHRVQGAKNFGIRNIRADIRQGTRRDAVLFSTGANGKHGLRRTNADKRRAVITMLQDEEWRQWSDRRIAAHCYVSHQFVSNLRAEFEAENPTVNSGQSRQGADGRTINVTNIGSTKKPPRFPVNGGLYYPVDFEHRSIYNDPRHTAEEIEAPYKPYLAADLLALDEMRDFQFIDSAIPRRTAYTCDDCGKKTDTVVYDFKTRKQHCVSCLEKHEAEQNQIEEQRRAAIPLLPDKWYPVKHTQQLIFNDPFDKQADGAADLRYRQGYAIQNGSLIIEGIIRGSNYATYQIVQPLARLHDMKVLEGSRDGLTVGILARWRYSPGMAAACRHCLRLYHGEPSASIHTDWRDTDKPGIWECPNGHRLADHLLKIVAPDPASEMAAVATPNPTPIESPSSEQPVLPQMLDDEDESKEDQKEAASQDLRQDLKGYYHQLKLRSRNAARRIMRIGYEYGAGPAREAAIACLEVMKAEAKMERDLAKARQENESLRALLKANRINIPNF
jgi:hypothetical protein